MNKEALLAGLMFGGGGGNGLPTIESGDAGKVLKVNSGETGTEWGDVPNELPAIASGDAGKVLKVNSGETGVEWGAASGGSTHYLHNLYIEISGGKFRTQLITDSSAALKKATVADAVANAGFNTSSKSLPASGYRTNSGTTVMVFGAYGDKISHDLIVFGVNASTGAELTVDLYTNTSGFYVTDTVVSI